MASTIQLKNFAVKASPVPADIVYIADSANSFNEAQTTIAELIAAYPALSSIGGLTTVANEMIYTTGANTYATTPVAAFGLTVLNLASAPTSPSASSLAAWDAHKNLSANSFIPGFTSTATAAGTTTLTVSSAETQLFTGSTTQTVLMPVTSTLVVGQQYTIINSSSGAVTVQSSGANTIQVMAANTAMVLTCNATSGTTAASWTIINYAPNTIALPLSIANGGTGVTSVTASPTASAWAAWDANSNMSANNFNVGYATTATAAGTTTLTVSSAEQQYFTGSTTQTVLLPVVSTCVLGQSWLIVNNSSGAVTVQSSGANTINVLAAGTQARYTVISTSGTTAASWNSSYNEGEFVIPVVVSQGGTGLTATTAYALLAGGTTTTGALQQVASSTSGFPLVYKGSSNLPAYSSTPTITQILDTNGNELTGFATVATAVNYVLFSNNSTGNAPFVQGKGSDSNVILKLQGQGTGGAAVQGTSTNDDAPSGYVGEWVASSVSGNTNFTTSNTPQNMASISLTAGDWDVYGWLNIINGSTPAGSATASISTTSITQASAGLGFFFSNQSVGTFQTNTTLTNRIKVNTTTTVYLVGQSTWSSGTATAFNAQIAARRVR